MFKTKGYVNSKSTRWITREGEKVHIALTRIYCTFNQDGIGNGSKREILRFVLSKLKSAKCDCGSSHKGPEGEKPSA